ncbi:MAG: xanthine dehydrogenase family protein molybdopterin-binding subunit [Anaerolineaceae bacterium]|nr:xanthine dehydrogenase family protein molybdopterin-binding subunit [Anaerolineaceae bacterium]
MTTYKPRIDRKFVGGYRPRVDAYEKAQGKAPYADDMISDKAFPGLLHARVLCSPYPRARIKSLDVSKAEALPGVKAILTYQDPEVARTKLTNAGWTDAVDTVSYEGMMWRKFRDRRVLGDYATWAGDEVGVVVAAETEQIAEKALRLVEVDWEVLPFVMDPIQSMQPDAPIIHPQVTSKNVLPPDPVGGPDVFFEKGDVDAGFKNADVVLEMDTVHDNPTQGSLDPWCCVAQWEGDKLTVVSNSYAADQTRMHVSQMLQLPIHNVRVVSKYVGGQFGRADTGDQPFFLFTALIAKKAGRPVKFKHSRRDSFHDTRQPALYHCKAGATRDGTITSLQFKSIGDIGAHADHSVFALKFAPAEIAEAALAPVANIKMESYAVYTNHIPGCMMRGVGNSQFNFIFGRMIDGIAESLNMDPVDLAVKNFTHAWGTVPDKSLQGVLAAGASRIGWAEKRHKPGEGPVFEGTKRRGVGFSMHPGWHAEWQEERRGQVQVKMTLYPDGTVTLDAPTVETGTGSNTCNVLGCAEALGFLGIHPEQISWVGTIDTDSGMRDCVQTDSAVSFLQSEVMVVAAKEMKQKLLALAAPVLEVPAEKLDIHNGVISGAGKAITVQQLLWKGDLVPLSVFVSRRPSTTKTGVPYIASFAEVEVDTATGRTQVLKLVIINDCGTVMYASGAEAQQIGGQVMALGEALSEEIIYDPVHGIPLNFNFIDYKIPTILDMPPVEPVLLEIWRGDGEYGACGIGEGTLTCTPRAVANAVYNAIGVRVDELPISSDRVLKALGII